MNKLSFDVTMSDVTLKFDIRTFKRVYKFHKFSTEQKIINSMNSNPHPITAFTVCCSCSQFTFSSEVCSVKVVRIS